ncbi:hypothetical protein C9J48_10315 [Photobacterium profundum]|uniref:Uncharacterized protein n=1 Tax=Photobacterium profundum 3TCK TaxID=314280 RepID=Q1Z3W1_9GAMM|nr:hypothetical protein P3TCK_09373 [Photobacterium profundum 3TCK]PSV62357.1 hypothetical protein C9J48_10315 [Photobacterium profundum]
MNYNYADLSPTLIERVISRFRATKFHSIVALSLFSKKKKTPQHEVPESFTVNLIINLTTNKRD